MSPRTDYDCDLVLRLLDYYLDRELTRAETEAIDRHLKTCEACTTSLSRIRELQKRIRSVSQYPYIPESLKGKIQASLEVERGRSEQARRWPMILVAAAAVVFAAVGASYQRGYLRITTGSQEAYIESVAPQVSPVMRVGLTDHIECAVFHPAKVPDSMETMLEKLGKGYRDLVPVLSRHIPPGYSVVAGHRCEYHGRKYVHLVVSGHGHLISLLLTNRGRGEAFEADLRSVAAEAGTPLYSAGVQRFSLAGFETHDHLVYLVSDLEKDQNLTALANMTSDLKEVIALREAAGKIEL